MNILVIINNNLRFITFMASIKIKFRPSTLKGCEGTLYYLIISRRKMKVISSNCKLFPEEWDNNKCRINFISADYCRFEYLFAMQKQIDSEFNFLKETVDSMLKSDNFNFMEIKTLFKNRTSAGDFLCFMRTCIDEIKCSGKEKTASLYDTTLRSFMNFREGRDVKLEKIDGAIMKSYELWLKNKGVSMNSISFYMRILRAVYNRAVNKGIIIQKSPFKNVYTGIDKTIKRAIGQDEITRLRSLELKTYSLNFARDMFLFSLYTRGMAYVDISRLKKSNIEGNYIVYNRSKTGQRLSVKLEPSIINIIDKYADQVTGEDRLLPVISEKLNYSSALRIQNNRLKKISEKMGLTTSLSSYVPRHTWASIAKRNGIPLNVISESMGHDNENTTRIYLTSLDQTVVDNANEKLLKLI